LPPSEEPAGFAGHGRDFRDRLARSRLLQLGFMLSAFVAATLVARLFGAGWGTASGVGQITFVTALVTVLVTDRRPSP
jgi:hypothetical protein